MKSSIATQIEGALLMLDDATPHVAVPVQATRDGEVIATTLSDSSGRYQLMDLKPGRYQLRCQVLGGYVYYKATDRPLRFTSYDSVTDDSGDILDVQRGKTLKNIDFRFARFKKGTWRNYNCFDGLAGDSVHAIHRDPGGVMWFGTGGDGVSRYDGKEFVNITERQGLVHNYVHAIYRDPDGAMWFGTRGGISRYDGKNFVNFTTEDGLGGYYTVLTIHRDTDGIIWFGTTGGVYRYDGEEFINFTTEDGLVNNNVWAINHDSDGVLWFGTMWDGGGVSRYDGKEFADFTAEDGLTSNSVIAIYLDPDGILWFATGGWIGGGGVSRYEGKKFTNLTTEDGLASDAIMAIHRDPDGILWFATYGGGISRYDGSGFVNFTTEDGLVHNLVWTIYCDPEGPIWAATYGGGISRYDAEDFVNLTKRDGLVDDRVYVIHRDLDGNMWFGTYGGVSRYDGKEFVNFAVGDGLANNFVVAIHQDPDGNMWFGTSSSPGGGGEGISRYDGNEFVNFTRKDGLAGRQVRAIHHDPDSIMWFGTDSGVSRYNGRGFVSFTQDDGLVHNSVNDIYRDPDGVIWVATGDYKGAGGISRYDGKKFVNFTTKDGLPDNWVLAIHRAPDGIMWFGTLGGVSRYDGREFVCFTSEDGLAHDSVNAIHCDLDGIMWFGTDRGVSAYDGTIWMSLDTRDGLADNSVTSILQGSDGFLWFGTEGGVTRYRPSTRPPKAYIVSVTTDQTYRLKTQDARLKTESLSIPAFTVRTRVTIEYSSIDFKTIPEKRQYRCRVYETGDLRHETSGRGELDSTVSSLRSDVPYLPPTKATTFDWTPEEPGTYVFEVQAIDRDLNYSEPASVELKVIPDPRNHRIIQLEEHIHQQELAELERVHRELEDARQIQQSLLPEQPPRIEGFEIAGASLPAREVSGDFYDYLALGENTGIALADVTGKSVKAAMIAAMANGMLHAEVRERVDVWDSPGMILRQLNTGLRPRFSRGMFTAMSLGILQVAGKRLLFSNAGMMYPIVKRGERVWELKVNGMPLGLIERAEYQDLSLDLKRGDLVIFYSDGIIEAENDAGEMYQTERLLELMQRADPGLSAQDMVDLIVRDVTAFVGEEESSDDITIVVLRYKE